MIIPGVVAGQSTIEATLVYDTRFLANFETGDESTPTNDDTGKRTTTYNQCEVASDDSKFGSGGLASAGFNGQLYTDFSSEVNVGGEAFTAECFAKNQDATKLLRFQVNIAAHDLSVSTEYNSENGLWRLKLYRFMSGDSGTVAAFSSEIYTQEQMDSWNHFALEGDGLGNFFLYFNGDEVCSIEDNIDIDSVNLARFYVGCRNISSPTSKTSFRDSVRLVVGERVYGGNFQPPEEALTDIQGYTYG